MLHVSTLEPVSPALRHHQRADALNASSSIEEPAGANQGGARNFVSDTMFISRFGRECNIGRACLGFERFGIKAVLSLLRSSRLLGVARIVEKWYVLLGGVSDFVTTGAKGFLCFNAYRWQSWCCKLYVFWQSRVIDGACLSTPAL